MTARADATVSTRSRWWGDVMRRVQERDIRRQITHERIRKAGLRFLREGRARAGIPALLPEYGKMLVGSALGFWIITWAFAHFVHVEPLYTLIAFGLIYSTQSSYYTYRLSRDPTFRIPRCGCAGAARDDSEVVLRSGASGMLKVPNAAWGALFYSALPWLVLEGHMVAAVLATMLAVLVSAYLAYVMVVRLAALCPNCINMAAVNLLILSQLLG